MHTKACSVRGAAGSRLERAQRRSGDTSDMLISKNIEDQEHLGVCPNVLTVHAGYKSSTMTVKEVAVGEDNW